MSKLPEFDELVKLAKENPEELERLRTELVQEVIDNAEESNKRKLRGLQFKIDAQRKLAKNPMDSCIKISRMMHDSFSKMKDILNEAQNQHISRLKTILQPNTKQNVKPVKRDDYKINNIISINRGDND